jgi:hypothetical protein
MAALETLRKASADGDGDCPREGVRVLASAPKGERAPERRPVTATQAGLDAGRQQVDCETTPGAPLRLIYRRESAGVGCPCRPTQAEHRLLPLVSSPCPWPATATTRAHPGA